MFEQSTLNIWMSNSQYLDVEVHLTTDNLKVNTRLGDIGEHCSPDSDAVTRHLIKVYSVCIHEFHCKIQ